MAWCGRKGLWLILRYHRGIWLEVLEDSLRNFWKASRDSHFGCQMQSRSAKLSNNSRDGTPNHTQTLTDATQKETAIDQQQHSCETLICQRHQTILRFLTIAATGSTRWRVRELYCQTACLIIFSLISIVTSRNSVCYVRIINRRLVKSFTVSRLTRVRFPEV
jgi:hypothetical protein